ncbi:uncharacterized protein N7473_007427 [Penicillium subrubescens]|uniref:Uncharacterized protein n=1 Tax=Penicillium subrubescens TaxID=1316194 RepID=A0A1Q5UQI8_9EURO|nr:uncharacterized protein N7473_007427 [Penicillium subrubescens]KAJ5891199.1 hypothetical protein N7473_007427 [Penicillium subrubescens]OKP14724.1 hypothetical protein PENSUB_11482 [Penicillium subrubescens]
MHFIIPIIVFVTANIWGLYSSIPFTNIDPARSIWDRALGGVQLASTVYTLDQIPRLLDEEAITHHLFKEYLDGWNATVVSETESAMTLSAGHPPLTVPLTVPPGFLPLPTLSTDVPVGLPGPDSTQHLPVDSLFQILLFVIFALVVGLMVKQNDRNRRLTSILEEIGRVQQYQETAWKGIYENHSSLAFLVSVAQDLRTAPAAHHAPAEVDTQENSHDSEGSTSSSDASSAVVIQTLQDVLASLDTLRRNVDRSTDVWEGLSERLEVFQSDSQDTRPTDSSGDDPSGSPDGGLVQDGRSRCAR